MKNMKILLIEDNDIDVHIAKSLLSSINSALEIERCKNGQEALDYLADKGITNPDIILLDINMPVMDGKEFLKERASLDTVHEIPVIIVTSSAIMAEKKECMELGANDYIEKPVSVEIFKEKLGLFKLDL